ncbi:beta-lactamase family protein [Bifidobacterium sp. 82T10]|uniref:Beta-lactamase family protein n=1 Tax=Bifidobacterium miconis TaxID=2834435 RepID=A0ABS6WFJ1_9BIFI|nr:serine hydrolase domain-containing protein [Bifidobacterium miconis]MBW3092047.1 beta-lactamase family protein [Bifidobacterium miconis]
MSDALEEHAAVRALMDLGGRDVRPASAVVGTIDDAGEMRTAAAGWAVLPRDVDDARPAVRPAARHAARMDVRRLIDVASVTKMASTTMLAMMLVDAGDLRLDDAVCRYLPGFADGDKSRVTVRQLMTHTAGLRPWWPLYCATTRRDEALRVMERLPLAAAPGSAWRYSDLGMSMMGFVIERITGRTIGRAFDEMIARPLHLTGGYGPCLSSARVADIAGSYDSDAYEYAMIRTRTPYDVPYTVDDFAGWREHWVPGTVNDGNAAHTLGGESGHAGLFASVPDLLAIARAVWQGRLCSHDVLDEFSQPISVHPGQAVGFRRTAVAMGGREETVLYHPGFTGTWFGFMPSRHVAVAGGAMRLYGGFGTIDGIRRDPARRDRIASSAGIAHVMTDALRERAAQSAVTQSTYDGALS